MRNGRLNKTYKRIRLYFNNYFSPFYLFSPFHFLNVISSFSQTEIKAELHFANSSNTTNRHKGSQFESSNTRILINFNWPRNTIRSGWRRRNKLKWSGTGWNEEEENEAKERRSSRNEQVRWAVDLYPGQPLWAISGSFEVHCSLADVIKTNYAYGEVIPHHFMP